MASDTGGPCADPRPPASRVLAGSLPKTNPYTSEVRVSNE